VQLRDPGAVTVLIVDDHAPFRSAARTVVNLVEGFTVAAEAGTGEAAVDLATEVEPDLVLMDINLPGINGIEATRQIKDALPATLVVLLSTYAAADLPSDALSGGAACYIRKEDFRADLIQEVWSGR